MSALTYKMAVAISENREASQKRSVPVLAREFSIENPYYAFQEMILNWAPRDVRLEPSYRENHRVVQTDSEFMQDVFRGISTQIIEKKSALNRFTVGIFFQSNMAEFEKYNEIVRQHNERWEKAGKPIDTFDPVTGDVTPLSDTHVRSAIAESPFTSELKVRPKSGTLSKAAPKIERSLMISIEFSINLEDDIFTVGFAAKNSKGEILYYNILQEKDLAYLARRITQELFGNHLVKGNQGPFLEGITYLIQGKKLSICRNNERPSFLIGRVSFKEDGIEKESLKFTHLLISIGTLAFQYVIPIHLTCYVIYSMFSGLNKGPDEKDGLFERWVIITVSCFIMIWISGKLAKWMGAKRDSIKHQLKFM